VNAQWLTVSNNDQDDNLMSMVSDMQQALKVLRYHNDLMIKALKEINHKSHNVVKHGAIDKQLQIDTLGKLAQECLTEIGALEKVI